MLALILFASLQTPAAAPPQPSDPFAPLSVLDGSWDVRGPSSQNQPDHLVNHCTRGQAFYTCEQVVNGKSVALLIFTVSRTPGKLDVDNVLPNGHASSDTDLFIEGNRWTYISNDDAGHPRMKVANTFTGRDHIHFVVSTSADGGKTWTQTAEGDSSRTRP